MLGLCSCMCSWCLRRCVYTGGLVHSEIQIPPLPKSKLGSDVSGCHPLVCSVRARVSEEGSRCPWDVPSQDRERSEPWHGLRPSPAQLSVPVLWKGVFTTHHPWAAAELPLCLQRAKHTQPIVNNNITEFFHIPDSSQHPQRSLSCSSTAQSQRPVIASQPWVLPGTPLPFPLPPPGPYHPFPYCTWPHQRQGWQENGKYVFN